MDWENIPSEKLGDSIEAHNGSVSYLRSFFRLLKHPAAILDIRGRALCINEAAALEWNVSEVKARGRHLTELLRININKRDFQRTDKRISSGNHECSKPLYIVASDETTGEPRCFSMWKVQMLDSDLDQLIAVICIRSTLNTETELPANNYL